MVEFFDNTETTEKLTQAVDGLVDGLKESFVMVNQLASDDNKEPEQQTMEPKRDRINEQMQLCGNQDSTGQDNRGNDGATVGKKEVVTVGS